jgi:hypothetical protein
VSVRAIWKAEKLRFRNVAKPAEEEQKTEQYQRDTLH